MLDRLRVFSCLTGPTFDLRREFLLVGGASFGADVGRRRVGLALQSPFLGIQSVAAFASSLLARQFILRSESGDGCRAGEAFSSASWREPRELSPLALRNPGSSRLGRGRLLVLDLRPEFDLALEADSNSWFGAETKLRLRLSSVRSSSHSLSEPAADWQRGMVSESSTDVTDKSGTFFFPPSSRSP